MDHWLKLDEEVPVYSHPDLPAVARRMVAAKEKGAARILMMGAHVIKAGMNRYVIDLMERGFVSHVAMNGAGAIHDFELARIGATSESVARYIRTGEFGLWRETGELNEIIQEAATLGLGLGENLGRRLESSDFPAQGPEHLRRRLPALGAGHRARGHRLRHYSRAPEL